MNLYGLVVCPSVNNSHDLDKENLLLPGKNIVMFPGLGGIPCLGALAGRDDIGGTRDLGGI